MSSSFDPYYKWLGIRPEEQPPNHYRLLGITMFETDSDVIASAADQRMAHVRSFQTGRHVEESQRILNEIAAARVCLLNPQKKAAYDASLPQMAATPVKPSPLDMSPLGLDLGPTKATLHAPVKQRKVATPYIMLAAVATVLILAFVAVLATRRSSPPPNDVVAAVASKQAETVQPVKASEVTPKVQVAQVNGPSAVTPLPASSPPSPAEQRPEAKQDMTWNSSPSDSTSEWISKDASYLASSSEPQGLVPSLPSLLTGEGPWHEDQFAFATLPEGTPPFIVVTLAVPSDVSGFSIQNTTGQGKEEAKRLTVWLSSRYGDWQKVWTAEKVEQEWKVNLQRLVPARYVKIGLSEPGSFRLKTVKVFGQKKSGAKPEVQPDPTQTGQWISKDATCIASSASGPHTPLPSLLTGDGPRHFFGQFTFETAAEPTPPFIVVTLANFSDLSGFYIQNRTVQSQWRAEGLTVWVSIDKKNWQQVWSAEDVRQEWRTVLPQPVLARHVKIGLLTPGVLHLRTIKLYGRTNTGVCAPVPIARASTTDSRHPIPDDAAQAKGLKLIKEVYGEEYKAAEIPDQKKAFARKLLAKAQEVGNDATSKYLLLKLARDVATEGGDRQTAFEAIDRMAEAFQVDAVDRKCDVLTSLSKRARTAPDHHAIIRQADEVMEAAVKADRFDLVSQLGELAISEATALRDSDLVKRVRTRVNSLRELAAAYGEARKAMETLKQTPDDPEANVIAGKHYSFIKGDWAKGLPMLAKGSDAAIKEVATLDLRGATTPDEQVKVGDRWCELADEAEGPVKTAMGLRAAHWYNRALPQATGLTKSKVEKRLKELASEAEGPVSTESKSKLAPAITGHFLVGMMQRRTKERKVVWWEFRPDQSVWEKDKQIGQWTATDTQVKVGFSDSSQATFRPKGREAFIGTQVRANGELWGCELQKVFVVAVWEHRWPAGADKLLLWSTGRLVTPDGASLWERKGDTLILRHANGSTDTCTISPDGKSYKGQNQGGAPISGKLISDSDS